MKLLEKKLPQDHSARANALNYLGDLRSAQGKKEEARQLFEQSVASWAKQSVPPLGAAEAHLRFAILCVDTGKTDNARKHFDAALAIYEKTAGLTSPDMAATLEAYAKLLQSTDAEQAAKLRERAAEARRRHVEENR
jgi:tetratricopeptide (TPR) repeat protein